MEVVYVRYLHTFSRIEKVEDIAEIISYGVMSTPAVMIDNQVAFVGGVPSKEQVESWFAPSTCSCGCCCK